MTVETKSLKKENEEFKEEVFKLRNEIARLENCLQHSEKEKHALGKTLS